MLVSILLLILLAILDSNFSLIDGFEYPRPIQKEYDILALFYQVID
jgi:hypothetical protein